MRWRTYYQCGMGMSGFQLYAFLESTSYDADTWVNLEAFG